MRVIAEESGSWMLFDNDGDLYLSVLCGTVGLYSVDLHLTPEESEQISCRGTVYAADLARLVRHNPTSYHERHTRAFDSLPGIKEATVAWRAAMSTEA
ncbi:hypothetical protein C0063_06330 [Pseudoxanthomonas sp. KAs_5_3]|jgi:hypothetical protein|nr:hypothetical protein C0063_06330 [Pseudoxanthomonas sp. KAs_5_3]SFV33492.1 hypothetical protein SAMN05428990_2337 [Pseudoxanthomonas sp. YR558]